MPGSDAEIFPIGHISYWVLSPALFLASTTSIKMGRAIVEIQARNGLRANSDSLTISLILAICQRQIISVAIQQPEIRQFYSETANI